MGKKLTQKQAEEKVKQAFDGTYRLVSKYTRMDEKATILHKPCGNEYEVGRIKRLTNERGCKCKKCHPPKRGHSTNPVTLKEFKKRLKKQVGSEYSYKKGFKNMGHKCILTHNKCGNEFEVSPEIFLGVKQSRCPICANKKRGNYAKKENYLNKLLEQAEDGDEYKWNEKYKGNNKKKHKIKHLICKNEYRVRPNDFQQGYRCPNCNGKEAKIFKKMKKLLKENNINFKEEVSYEDLKYKSYLNFDLLIEDNFILEFDGSQHFSKSDGYFKETNIITDWIKNTWINKNKNFNFLRVSYKKRDKTCIKIIKELISNNFKLSLETINKYNLYYYNKNLDITYNKNAYYTDAYLNYFEEYHNIINESRQIKNKFL